MARALQGLKRFSTGHSDIEDNDDDTRLTYEVYMRLPKALKEYFKSKCKPKWMDYTRDNSINEGQIQLDRLWPQTLSNRIGRVRDVKDFAEYMSNEATLINSNIFEKIFYRYIPYYERLFHKFGDTTINSIRNNVSFGNRIIISRVVESNVKNVFRTIPETLQQSIENGFKPLIQLYLLPVDKLEDSAKKEADFLSYLISSGCRPEDIVSKKVGVSYIDFILKLRYLWLYLGTITLANAFIRWAPKYFSFHFGYKDPSARCTLIEMKQTADKADPENGVCDLGDTLYVQLYKNDVGFNGIFYQHSNPYSSFDYDLYKEFTYQQEVKSENHFPTIYSDAQMIEDKILNNNHQLIDSLTQNKYQLIDSLTQNNLQGVYSENKEFHVPAIVDMWKKYSIENIQSCNLKLGDILKCMEDIANFQKIIDLYLIKIREPIEGNHK